MIEILNYDIIRIITALIMLGIACFLDLKKREINDILWVGFGGIAVLLLIFDPDFQKEIFLIGFSLIVSPLAIVAWRLGLFGGADAFALIVLAGLSPMSTITTASITPFTTLTNAAILFIIPIIINITRNCISILRNEDIFNGFNESITKKIFAICIGYRAKNPKFAFIIEKTSGNIKKFDLTLHNAETAEFCNEKNKWVTPGIPYLFLITGGFIIQIIYGDILMRLFTN